MKRIWQGAPLGFERSDRAIDYHAGDDAAGNAPFLVVGPPGSFKTVGPVMCQLLDDGSGERSYVIFGDGKGEVTSVTKDFRATVSTVAIANYDGVLDLKSDGYNPLRRLDPDAPGFADECEAMAMAIVKPEPNDHNKHFTDGGRSAATLAIMRTCRQARAKNRPPDIREVREFLQQEPKKLRAVIEEIVKSGTYDERTRATKFLSENTEIQNLKSTLEVATSWMTEEICKDMAVAGGIDFGECKKRSMTIYYIVPTKAMKAKASYIRMGLSDCLRSLYNHDGIPTTVHNRRSICAWISRRNRTGAFNTSRLWLTHDRHIPKLPAN
jgi:type IV secretory pathway TraG/TraD family ATPase VirD4